MASVGKEKAEKSELKVRKMAGLVEYEAGSIVSKTIIDKKTVSISVFAFDKFQEIVRHVLPYDAFFYVLEGMAEVSVDNTPFVVNEGEMIVLPANKSHAIGAKSKFKMLLVTVKE